jgi:hypothetical protein
MFDEARGRGDFDLIRVELDFGVEFGFESIILLLI